MILLSRVGVLKPQTDPALSSERGFLSRAFVFLHGHHVNLTEIFSACACVSPPPLFSRTGAGGGERQRLQVDRPSALTGRVGSAPAFGDPLHSFWSAPRSRSTCASAKFAFAALGSFGIRAEASLLCKQTQRS
ncbi:hypothetical protein NN561_006231 [Cricetulus griseus]